MDRSRISFGESWRAFCLRVFSPTCRIFSFRSNITIAPSNQTSDSAGKNKVRSTNPAFRRLRSDRQRSRKLIVDLLDRAPFCLDAEEEVDDPRKREPGAQICESRNDLGH